MSHSPRLEDLELLDGDHNYSDTSSPSDNEGSHHKPPRAQATANILRSQTTGSRGPTDPKSHFPLIIFRGVEDSYTAGADLECRYSVAAGHETRTRDWVGIFKVGWRSQTDFICCEFAPEPRPILEFNVEKTGNVKFNGSSLPNDDGEFYQFCYVSSEGQVLGASTPFQFKKQELDDFVAVEEENGELLVIKSKSAVLEDQLRKANETRLQLKQEIKLLEEERSMLWKKESELQKKLAAQQKINADMKVEVQNMEEEVRCTKEICEHYHDRIDHLQERLDTIVQEKQEIESRLNDNDRYIGSLQEKIKSLVNEKDSLTGRVRSLEEEKELFKGHFTTSENTLQSYMHECERVKLLLVEEQAAKSYLRREIERLETELQDQRKNNEAVMKTAQSEKENVSYITERMRNAEDKLSAAEHCKMMLNDEVLTLKMAYENTVKDLEAAKLQMDRMNDVQSSSVSSLTNRVAELSSQLISKEKESRDLSEELESCHAELQQLRQQQQLDTAAVASSAADDEGPLYALRLAQDALKERYDKLTKQNSDLQRALESANTRVYQLLESDDEQKREIVELRDRLMMGQEAYKEKYIEWERLETEMYRLKLGKSSSSSATASSKESLCSTAAAESKLLQQLLQAKSRKYKKLYGEQKKLSEQLKHQLQLKDEEIDRLRKLVASSYPPAEYATVTPKSSSSRNQAAAEMQQQFLTERHQLQSAGTDEVDGGIHQAAASAVMWQQQPVAAAAHVEDDEEVFHTGLLAPPLKPLPAPIIPERLHSGNSAASAAARRLSTILQSNSSTNDVGLNVVSSLMDEDSFMNHATTAAAAAAPSAPPAEQQLPTAAASMTTTVASMTTTTATDETCTSVTTTTTAAVTVAVNGNVVVSASTSNSAASAAAATAADNTQAEEDRFEDAQEGDMHIMVKCPCCSLTFTFLEQDEVAASLDHHFNTAHSGSTNTSLTICPLCNKEFPPEMSSDLISQHVDMHFTN